MPTVPHAPAADHLRASPRLVTADSGAASCEPVFGQTLVVDVPPGGLSALWAASPALEVRLLRHGAVVATARVPLPGARLHSRGTCSRGWALLQGTPHLAELEARAAHKLLNQHGGVPEVLVHCCVVLKSGHEESRGGVDGARTQPVKALVRRFEQAAGGARG